MLSRVNIYEAAAAVAVEAAEGDGLCQAVIPPGTFNTIKMIDMCWTPYSDSFFMSLWSKGSAVHSLPINLNAGPSPNLNLLQVWREVLSCCCSQWLCYTRPVSSSHCCPSAQQHWWQTTAVSWSSIWHQTSFIRSWAGGLLLRGFPIMNFLTPSWRVWKVCG